MRILLLMAILAATAPGALAQPAAGVPSVPPASAPAQPVAPASSLATQTAAPPPAIAAPPPAPADTTARTFRLRAGKARSFLERGERVTILEGGVLLLSDSTTVESRWARAYRERELAYFYEDVVVHDGDVEMAGDTGEFSRPEDYAALAGEVRIRDPRGVIHADRARYWRGERRMWLWGHVDFQDAKTRVRADSVLYREAEGVGDAFGNVIVTDVETGSEARGPRAVYDRNTGVARLDSQPRLVLREAGSEDTEVEAAALQFDRDERVVRARGDVRLRRGTTTAAADSAILYRDRELVELRGRPVVEREATRMRGREIDVHYRDRALQRVAVRRDARMIQTRTDTLLVPGPNEVRGDSATLYFEAGELCRAVVVGDASSRYAPVEKRPDRVSLNEAAADSIVMLFENDDVEEVLFIGSAAGTYRYFEGDLAALRRPPAARFDTTYGVVRGDTTRFDFGKRAEVVDYSAERILYLAAQNDLLLQKAAEVRYQSRTLRAGRIRYDADTDLLDATERPVLDDAGNRMYGETMGYDLATRRAWIRSASTQYDQGFYTGKALRKNEEGVLQVARGSYTTCDLAHPHYRFESDEMKIYLHDKVVGRPVRLYLGNVPVGYLPFFVNSVNTERHSGFMQPDIEIGVGGNQRYIHGLDYYWAASRYFDLLFSGDYTDWERPDRTSVQSVLDSRDTRSLGLRVHSRYKLRYRFEGNLDYSVQRGFGDHTLYWTLGGSHQQTLGERATLRGNLDYSSSSRSQYLVNQNYSYQRALQRQLTSGLTLSRPGDLVTFSANLRRTQLLDPDERFTGTLNTNTLPALTVTFRSIRLGPAPADPQHPGVRGFLHSLQLTPNVSLARTTTETRVSRPLAEIPPEGVALTDSFRTVHNEVVTASTRADLGRQVAVWFLNLSPSIGYGESYRRDRSAPDLKRHTRNLGMGLGASTTFYGLFHPGRWGINAIRHRIDPSASLSYAPAIAGQQARSTFVNLRLSNQFDAKIQRGKEERRIDGLFDWSLGTSYNPAATAAAGAAPRKFANINSTITVNRSGPLRLTISQTYDPYRGKVTYTQIPFGLRLSGKFGYGDTGREEETRNRVVEEEGELAAPADSGAGLAHPRVGEVDAMQDVEPVQVAEEGAGTQSWELALSYSFTRTLSAPADPRVGIGLGIDLTRNWHLAYSASYDGRSRQLGNPSLHITRSLHCWKASFARVYDAYRKEWRYYFRLWVDRHQTDLFFESGERSYGY